MLFISHHTLTGGIVHYVYTSVFTTLQKADIPLTRYRKNGQDKTHPRRARSQVYNFLVISDLHIGIENELYDKGVSIPEQTGKLLKRIENLKEKTKNIIITGDVKHLVPRTVFREQMAIKRFFESLNSMFGRVILTLGNHDVLLPPLDIEIYPSTGFRYRECCFFHGHAYPGDHVAGAKNWFIGHEHGAIEFVDRFGFRTPEPAWLRIRKVLYEEEKSITLIPPFNPLVGSGAGEKFLSPVLKSVKNSEVEVFLLDGTYLGTLELIRSAKNA